MLYQRKGRFCTEINNLLLSGHAFFDPWEFLTATRFLFFFFPRRQFLFKPGGTSPMYCTTSPGYPLTSSTVYSPPPRPLPRNTFSRPAFSLKKPYKHCNWKCAALSAILISVMLLFLLAYFIGESPLILPHTSVGSSTYPPQLHPPTLLQTQNDSMPFFVPPTILLIFIFFKFIYSEFM